VNSLAVGLGVGLGSAGMTPGRVCTIGISVQEAPELIVLFARTKKQFYAK
jgi:hypothetical protein